MENVACHTSRGTVKEFVVPQATECWCSCENAKAWKAWPSLDDVDDVEHGYHWLSFRCQVPHKELG